jgi:hypothetical protein
MESLYISYALNDFCRAVPLIKSVSRVCHSLVITARVRAMFEMVESAILRLISDLLDRKSLVNVTWPVFVAAVELDPSDDELCRAFATVW